MTDQEVWGTGYGSKRHLLAPGSLHSSRYTRKDEGRALCDSTTTLSIFDREGDPVEDRTVVQGRTPCQRCVARSAAKLCPTCGQRVAS